MLPEALLTVDGVGGVLRIGREHVFVAFCACALVEPALIAQGHPLAVAARRAEVGHWQAFLFVERDFLGNDQELFLARGIRAGACF